MIKSTHSQTVFIDLAGRIAQKYEPSEKEVKYFAGNYPVLAKFIPMHTYSFQKYDGNKSNRFMGTMWCNTCSKLSLYDESQKIGFFSHLDSEEVLFRSLDDIKARLRNYNMNSINLIGRDIPGRFSPSSFKIKAIKEFFNELGLKENQIHQPREAHEEGGFLDLFTGVAYEFRPVRNNGISFKKSIIKALKERFSNEPELLKKGLAEMEKINKYGEISQQNKFQEIG